MWARALGFSCLESKHSAVYWTFIEHRHAGAVPAASERAERTQRKAMSRKPNKKEMAANLLGGLGLQQIEGDLYGDVEADADLEKELSILLGAEADSSASNDQRQRSPPKPSPKKVARPAAAAATVDFNNDDDDVEFDENDPELLSELQGIVDDSPVPSPKPSPKFQPPSSGAVAATISERIAGYQRLVADTADVSKKRRLERNVQTLTAALADVRAGRQVDLESLPPDPPASQPPQAANVRQAVLNYISPSPPPPPPPPATGASGPEILELLELRAREYRSAAAAAKAAGAIDDALELLRTSEQFVAAVKAVKGGQTVDPDDIPGPPPPLLLPPQKPTQPAASPTPPKQQQPAPAKSPAGGGGLVGELAARHAAYKFLQDKATTDGDSGKARRMGRIVAQYTEAQAALKAGASYDFAGLPPPPGFDPLPSGPPPRASLAASSGPAAVGGASAVTSAAMGGKAGVQLRQLEARQLQYRQAALQAKRAGNMEAAKRMLAYAKGCEPMMQAAQAGMPVDLGQLPPLPGEPGAAAASVTLSEVCEAPKELQDCAQKDPATVYELLEKTLREKLAVAEENARKFKSMGQITTADRWAKLSRTATADLDYLLSQKRLKKPPPAFSFVWQNVSAVRCNPDLGENTLEVRVINGISLPLPEGYKEADLETQVKIELPITTEAPLTQTSGWVKASCSPAYDFVTKFEVNRKARSTGRVLKTRGLKFDVTYRRGFLKKDGLLGTATMKLDDLETACTVHQGLDLLDGRKAVGGRLEVQVRLREPLAGAQTDQVREQWLILEHRSQDLPPSRQSSAAGSRPSAAPGAAGSPVPDFSSYVVQYEISLLKPHCATNPKAAEAVRGLEQRLAQHKQLLAACTGSGLRQYCSNLQQLAGTYAQHAKAALHEKDRGKAEKFLRKKKEADREFQDVSSRLR